MRHHKFLILLVFHCALISLSCFWCNFQADLMQGYVLELKTDTLSCGFLSVVKFSIDDLIFRVLWDVKCRKRSLSSSESQTVNWALGLMMLFLISEVHLKKWFPITVHVDVTFVLAGIYLRHNTTILKKNETFLNIFYLKMQGIRKWFGSERYTIELWDLFDVYCSGIGSGLCCVFIVFEFLHKSCFVHGFRTYHCDIEK